MSEERVPVLIVGGGLCGLTSSLLLTWHGVRSLLVERHAGTSPQPKARRFNARSLEIYRALGLTDEITEASAALANFDGMLTGPTLAEATWPELTPALSAGAAQRDELDAYTPVHSVLCPQDVLEPILRTAAEARGADVRFGTELLSLEQDDDGVTATIHDRTSGERRTVRADYVIAADGANSPVRESLGIPRSGLGHLADNLDVYFRADLAELIQGREFNLCQIDNPAASGAFVSINGTDRWLFSTSNFVTDSVRAQDFDRARLVDMLRTVIGVPDVHIEVISTMPWESGMYVADQYANGRVFLTGDAAHAMPPMAASGANTGIQDVYNLTWKLAAALDGTATPALLDSYHDERYPVGYFTAEFSSQASGHLGTMLKAITDGAPRPFSMAAGFFGTQYSEGALVPDDRDPAPLDRCAPEGRPGTRVPHAWVCRDDASLSTLDLLGSGFTVLTGPDGTAWHAAAKEATRRTGVGIEVHSIGQRAEHTELAGDWLADAAIKPNGALLSRPDAIVAWHSVDLPADPAAALETVLGQVLRPR